MTTQAAHAVKTTFGAPVLYMALELSDTRWKVLFANLAGKRRETSVPARALGELLAAIVEAKRRLGLAADVRVVSCYEAGRDGFWLHWALRANGVENHVVDSSSIEVPRRARHRKTDRLDLAKLMEMLQRWLRGEAKVWSVLRVPLPEEEDLRRLSRAIGRLKAENQQHRARIKSLLATQGIKVVSVGGTKWAKRVSEMREWNGAALGPHLQTELILEGERLGLVQRQLSTLKIVRDGLVATSQAPIAVKSRMLAMLCGIAQESSFVFSTEVLGWRTFENRRQLAGSVGIVGVPWQSGNIDREQGISKAGNKRMRTMLIEIALCWLRYQPGSALSQWWEGKYRKAAKRQRKTGIVALARKLLVALWRYLEEGIVPVGAVLKVELGAR